MLVSCLSLSVNCLSSAVYYLKVPSSLRLLTLFEYLIVSIPMLGDIGEPCLGDDLSNLCPTLFRLMLTFEFLKLEAIFMPLTTLWMLSVVKFSMKYSFEVGSSSS